MLKIILFLLLNIISFTNQRFPFISLPFNRKGRRRAPQSRNTQPRNRTNYTSYFYNSTIPSLTDKDFDIGIHDHKMDYFILFTVKRCLHCNDLIKTFEEVQNYYNNTNESLKFYKVDCIESGWTALRFELNKIPMFIYISNRVYAGFSEANYTKESIIEFIESKHKLYKLLPDKMGYIGVAMKIFHAITDLIKTKFSFWNEGFSFAVIIIIIFLFFYFEFHVFKKCCQINKKKSYSKFSKDGKNNDHYHDKKNKITKNNKVHHLHSN